MNALLKPAIEYPESDGMPMAENTLQFRWITTLVWGLRELFRTRDDVFVAGDLFWYPVEGNNKLRQAPDALVVFGRPPGERGSYRQWEEGNIAPQVAFEVLSPGNRPGEMARKILFYEQYGVQEYYIYDPDEVHLEVYMRNEEGELIRVTNPDGFISPLLGVRFDLSGEEMVVYRPDGLPLLDYSGAILRSEEDYRMRLAESARADQEAARAREEAARAREEAARARDEAARADDAIAEVERLRQKLRNAGLEDS